MGSSFIAEEPIVLVASQAFTQLAMSVPATRVDVAAAGQGQRVPAATAHRIHLKPFQGFHAAAKSQ